MKTDFVLAALPKEPKQIVPNGSGVAVSGDQEFRKNIINN